MAIDGGLVGDIAAHLLLSRTMLLSNLISTEPNKVWVTDITYIRTHEGWLYLAVVLDLFSRQVIGWSMQPRMESDLVITHY